MSFLSERKIDFLKVEGTCQKCSYPLINGICGNCQILRVKQLAEQKIKLETPIILKSEEKRIANAQEGRKKKNKPKPDSYYGLDKYKEYK